MIRQPFLMLLGCVAIIIAAVFALERLYFLSRAEKTNGYVSNISSYEGRCGGGRRRASYPCTRYSADIKFYGRNGSENHFDVDAGSMRYLKHSYGNLTSGATSKYTLGQSIPIIFNPNNPSRAYIDSTMDVWATPLGCLLGGVICMISSLFEPRRSSYSYW